MDSHDERVHDAMRLVFIFSNNEKQSFFLIL